MNLSVQLRIFKIYLFICSEIDIAVIKTRWFVFYPEIGLKISFKARAAGSINLSSEFKIILPD